MKSNMGRHFVEHDLPWDEDWYRRLGFCDVHSEGPFLEMSLDMSA
jgi:hypothetical protein